MFKKLLILTIASLFAGLAWADQATAQTGSLTGTITDRSTGETLIGASVLITDIDRGAVTDVDGSYTISDVPTGTYNVRFSYIGYRTISQEVEVQSGTNNVDVEMRVDVTGLEDVVVTGIASSTSRAISEVAVSRVDASEYTATQSYADLSQLVGGKIAGVGVQPSGGTVGAGIRFNVRSGGGIGGSGQPVIYMDGVRIDNSQLTGLGRGGQGTGTLADINMDEVASIDFLKGPAAAALYGTNGSNGVVLITTKRGQGTPGQGSVSVNVRTTQGASDFIGQDQTEQFGSTEAINDVFRTGTLDHRSVRVSGGTEFIRFNTSVDQRLEEGIMDRNYMDRQNFRANFDAFPREDLTLSVSAGYSWNEIQLPDNDNNVIGYLGNTVLATPGVNEDGDVELGFNTYSFTAREAIDGIEDVSRTTRFIGSAQVQYRPIENLEITGSIGYDGGDLRRDEFIPPGFFVTGPGTAGERTIVNRINQQYTYDFNARYNYDIVSGLEASTVVGTQLFDRTLRSQDFTKRTLGSQVVTNIGSGADFIGGDENFLNIREAGVFLEQTFNYENTYMGTIGGRQDFAAAFRGDVPNIFYPKVSAAVRLDNVFDLPEWSSFLKLRAAYGESGQLPDFNDGSARLWSAVNSGYGTGGILDFVGTPGIEPERIREVEFGLEAELFERLGLDLTYYIQRAEDSIIGFREPPSTGITNLIPFNVGGINGNGFEAALTYTPIETENTKIDIGTTYTYQNTEVTDLGGAQPIFDGFSLNVLEVGQRRSEFYVAKVHGALFDENGVYAGVDAESERSAHGNPIPVHSGAFTLNAQWKNFSAYAQVDYAYDVYVYNNTKYFAINFRNFERYEELRALLGLSNIGADDVDALTPGTPEYESAANEFAKQNLGYDSGFIERADWLKLREVSLSYNFRDILERFGADGYVNSLNVSIAGRNLFTTSKYSGIDPEVNFAGARSLSRGQDFLTMPQPRQYYFTVSLGF
ncbi:MAG: carboxypeptidase-like regulatory domain-containing protein [Balneolaceae bacterium]